LAFQSTVDKDDLSKKIELIAGDLLQYISEEKYDIFFAHWVLQHFESPEVLFEHLNSLIKLEETLLCVELP
jgi:trans-aconitate methyltransferase|tara:strand:+ start:141 stop:353 length:213 start_codon:yes stop_codon:yes gene_type:complete